ncbi:RNA polymerase sigma factor [Candidatus Amoebophilus asiaticus]|nr:RNA polymerase sigma factor [Candidatus Amoebophilus asiaticus]
MALDKDYRKKEANEIIEGCINGDRKSQELLYRKYAAKMYGICKGYSNDNETAKDILQEGFIKVFRNIKDYRGGSLDGWVRRIIINTAIDFYRKSVQELKVVTIEDYKLEPIENKTLSNMNVNHLLNFIQELPEGARLVFNLFAIEGYSHKEIATKLNISEGTSKSQFNRARFLLQDMILKTNV